MTDDEFNNLNVGDIVQGKFSGEAFIIVRRNKDNLIGIRTVDISHPLDWVLVKKAVVTPGNYFNFITTDDG